MHFKINKKTLIGPLTRAASLAGSATGSIPILSDLLLTVNFGELTIIGGDGVTYFKSIVTDFEDLQSGSACVPAKKLQEIISKMGEVIELTSNTSQITIINNKTCINLSISDWEIYPALPEETGNSISVTGNDLKNAIKKTAFAVAENPSTPVLQGVKLTANEGKITAIACDRHRLAQTEILCSMDDSSAAVVVKGKSLIDLEKMIDATEEVSLTFGKEYFFCKSSNFTFYSRLLDGSYPDTTKIIPDRFQSETKINKDDFRNALERARIVAKADKTNIVMLTLSSDKNVLEVTTEADTATDELEIVLDGEPIKLSFNSAYVIDALKTIAETNCMVKFAGPMKPFILHGEGNTNDVQLVLPYRTR